MAGTPLQLTIESRMDAVPLLGKLVNSACAAAGASRVDCSQVEVCIVEAVNNCIKHAYGDQPGNQVEVDISFPEGGIKFEIIDHGKAGDPAQILLDRRDRLELDPADLDEIPESGRGIAIIQAVMDEIDYCTNQGVNRLTLTKLIRAKELAE